MSNQSFWKTVLLQLTENTQNIRGNQFLEIQFYAKPIPFLKSKKRLKVSKEDYIDNALEENFDAGGPTFCGRAWVPLFDSIEKDIAFQKFCDKPFQDKFGSSAKSGYIGMFEFLGTLNVSPEQYLALLTQSKGDHLPCLKAVSKARLPAGHNCFFAQIKVSGRKNTMKRLTHFKIVKGSVGMNWEPWMTSNIQKRLEQVTPSSLGKGELALGLDDPTGPSSDDSFGPELDDLLDSMKDL